LQGVGMRACPGCDKRFTPTRRNQLHCRPSCRVLALERRRQRDVDLFTACADAIEWAVFDN
jgi:predicted nucleic acid-binding Zn ribbon protein